MNKDKALFRLEREKLLLTGEIPRLFMKYALPGVAGLLFLGIQSVIDGIVLGRFVGANALASVNLVLPCYSLISAFAIVMGIGGQTLVSISLGRGDKQEANNALRSVFVFLLGMSVVVSLVIFLSAGKIASFLGANEVLLPDAVHYIRALVPFFPLLCAMFFGDYIIKAMGHPLYATSVMGMTVVLNIVLDLVFVAVLGWGVMGAGLATGIAFTMGACFNVPRLFSRHEVVAVQRGRYDQRLVWNAFYNGSSEGMSELSVAITVFLFNITMMRYLGESGVAAFTAINYILFIGTTVFLGISDGIIPIIGYNYGAGQQERIKLILKLAARTNSLIGIGLFLLLLLFGEQVIGLFFKDHGSEAFEIASRGVSIYCFAFLLCGLNILASSYFTAIGNAKISIIISALRGLVFVGIGILVLPAVFGIDAIWYDVPIAEICTLSVSFWLVRRSLFNNRSN
ncbi:MATE family efflux transporter [Parabacteroides sp. BX2]|jgi:Na+-driven multidrug efflux pump|uniref:Multidrug export protein MepA n=1 Tax=Parabacteroides segnis TaxID=2763058 RepID=A0ABR7E7V4_9BACT|nr:MULTISPECIES: MATE family efflux transporter [Parabacteroides]MBC5645855.1 MATE family efflux transporter [Parabacteroides segnis]MCM0715679.1 MATE family efflux transporter [Parabacteroides sp. TA-V-105]